MIDADPIARRPVVEALLARGARVVEAATCAHGLHVERPVDAVVVSLPPDLAGWGAAIDGLRARWPKVPVFASSVVPAERLAHLAEGVHFLPKPIPTAELCERLGRRLRSKDDHPDRPSWTPSPSR